MTPQEAIEAIKIKEIEINGNALRVADFFQGIGVATQALKKQIPKKLTNYSIDNNGYMIYDCECPSCKLSHREYYPFAYCNHCGQALDWSDTE